MSLIDKAAALTGWRGLAVCLFIGLLGILGHSPFHIWPVTIFILAVVFKMITLAPTPKRAFRMGLTVGFGYFMGQIWWIGSAFIARGPEFIPAMPPMIFGLAFILALFWGLGGYVFQKFKSETPLPFIMLALIFFMAEFLRGHVLGGFPWNLPGYIFKAGGPMSQSASLFGVYGLSLFVMITAALTARFLFSGDRKSLIAAGVLLIANAGFGMARLSSADIQYVDGVKLRIVQVPFLQKEKMTAEGNSRVAQEYVNMGAEPGLADITHVIWPEGAVDDLALGYMSLRRAMGDTFAYYDSTPPIWLMNSLRLEKDETGKRRYYNTSAALDFSNNIVGDIVVMNDKTKLVPFGEFIPGGEPIEKLGAQIISSELGSISPAPVKLTANFPGLPSGSPQICYEVIFPGITPRKGEVNWILNQSNDAWYGKSIGPYQHANLSKYRAIEERVPLIRAAANGFSGVTDPYGRFITELGPDSRGVIDSRLPQPLGESLPIRLIGLIMALLSTGIILIPWRRQRRHGGADV